MLRRRLLLLTALLSLVAGCVAPQEPLREPPLSPQEEKGRQVFLREPCYSACHVTTLASPAGTDTTGFVPDLRKTPRRTRDWYLAYFVDPRALLPYSFMPSFAHLTPDDADALIAFLQRLNRDVKAPKPEPVPSADIPVTPRDFASYQAGQALYGIYCEGCHGISGNGGGSVGHLLLPEPRDFTDGAWMSKQTENYLFAIVEVGKPNTAMPGFKEILTPVQRALVLRYIEYFPNPVERERLELGFALKSEP